MPLIEIKNIVKTYTTGEDSFNALNGVSFSVEKGEFVAIMGTSGSGIHWVRWIDQRAVAIIWMVLMCFH